MNRRVALLCAACALLAASAAVAEEPVERAAAESGVDPALALLLRGQIFADWELRAWEGDSFNAFELRRAELGAGFRWRKLGGMFLNLEGVRSASPESLLGVDGNSFLLRVKHAYAFGDPELGPGRLILRAGLIEDAWVSRLESNFGLRGYDATSSERTRLFETSDLGVTVGYDLLDELAALRVSATNGEGRNDVEQNRGKNTTIVLTTVPFKPELLGEQLRTGLHLGYRDGSVGVGRARNHRVFGSVFAAHPRAELGAEFVRALGVENDGAIEAQVISAWLRAEPIERWLGAFFRYEQFDANLDVDDDLVRTLQGGFYSDLLRDRLSRSRLRLYLAGELAQRDINSPEVPGVPTAAAYRALRVTIDATGLFDSQPNLEDSP